ncbi:MAG: arsenical pump-driving ATPase [Pirellulales bacterium]
MNFLGRLTRNLFFTGKGGVGKTSIACATAVQLADSGKKVLLVSTDPASNLDEVLGISLGNKPTRLPEVLNVSAMNLDPEKSAAEYRERMVGPYRDLLPEAAVRSMEEQFSGSCTLEIAAFDEFSRLLGDPDVVSQFDHVVFDTAPTGHTLRLLSLPSAWSGFLAENSTGISCLGPLAGLQAQQKLYHQSVTALADTATTTLILVARAEASALREAARTSAELSELGIRNQHLIINGVFRAVDAIDPYAVAFERRNQAALENMPDELRRLESTVIPFSPEGVIGLDSLRKLGRADYLAPICTEPTLQSHLISNLPDLSNLIKELVTPGSGVILTMGKGGVGKTTVAAAIAVAIAELGYEVHLSPTDPAAHLSNALNQDVLNQDVIPPTLTIDRIDPKTETAKYAAEVLAKAGQQLDQHGKALLEEDLRSPCTEEIAVFRAFAEAVAEGVHKFVVLDTAPTGHTILLLDAALAFHRELARQTSDISEAVRNLLPRLRDPCFTRVLIVTLPEATPVHEAAALQRDLRRAQIEPFAWIVNQVTSELKVTDPILKRRQYYEQKYLREVQQLPGQHWSTIPWQLDPPEGIERLRKLIENKSTPTV